MKPRDFTLNSHSQADSAGNIRWLSFFSSQDFDFLLHGLTIKSQEQNISRQSENKTLARLLGKISSEDRRIIVPQQIHGSECLTIKEGDPPKRKYVGDAILTDRKDILLTISVADCLPVFLVEPRRKVVGLVHAGWRGTLMGIARESIRKAKREFGCDPKDLTLLFGPAIQRCCYEISEGIAVLFDEDCLLRMPGQSPRLDLISANLKQFLSCGVKREGIFTTSDCTCCRKDMFHSFRRDGDKAGRMIAFLGIK